VAAILFAIPAVREPAFAAAAMLPWFMDADVSKPGDGRENVRKIKDISAATMIVQLL